MSDFQVGREPPREPVGMKIVGVGVILSCLLLSGLFGWGVYLNLTIEPCKCEEQAVDDAAAEEVTFMPGAAGDCRRA